MPTGTSRLYRPVQSEPAYALEPDNSYFLIRIHDAQAFFPGNILNQAKFLLFSSSVETSFLPESPMHSLHKLTALKRNTPYHLGINTNLTSWLPARSTDKIRIILNYIVMQGTPIKTFVDKMEQLNLEAVISLIRSDLAIAVKISQIAGHVLSALLREGEQVEIFPLTMDLNLADLQAGYYAVLGSSTDEMYPSTLEINRGNLTRQGGHELSRYSYVVIQVQSIKRRGPEVIRSETWGELLHECKDKALNATIRNENERDEFFQRWKTSLELVRFLARKDHSFLEREVDAVIAEAQATIEQKLLPRTTLETQALETYSDEWQQILNFSTSEELHRSAHDYQIAVELSERLLQQYQSNCI